MKDSSPLAPLLLMSSVLALLVPAGLRVYGDAPPPAAPDLTQAEPSPRAAESSGLIRWVYQATGHRLDDNGPHTSMDVVLATVPDPEDSPLSLLTDESVDAISSSAVRAGYLVDAHRLPWARKGSSDSKPDADGRKPKALDAHFDAEGVTARIDVKLAAREEEENVGALLFRRGAASEDPQWLLVLLVAESPVTGVSRAPLERALHLAGCEHTGATLRMLGPSFTGSAASLWRRLNLCVARANIVSGSATGEVGEDALTARHRFGRTVVSDAEMLKFLVSKLEAPNNEAPDQDVRIGVFAENGTGYASFVSEKTQTRIHHYQLPLHLGQLRTVQASQQPTKQVSSLRHGLSFNLGASGATRQDRVPAFSELTSLEVETLLRTMLQNFEDRRLDHLVIVATDPADTYFVASEARVYAPTAQRIAFGGSLLFTHPEADVDLSGMLMVSSYPLSLPLQVREPDAPREHRQFGSDTAEGTFNAMQWLIADLDLHARRPLSFQPYDYDLLGDGARGPRPWLMLIDKGRLWPLRHGAATATQMQCDQHIDVAHAPTTFCDPQVPLASYSRYDSQGRETTLQSATNTPEPKKPRSRVSPVGVGFGLLTLFASLCQLYMLVIAIKCWPGNEELYVRAFAAPTRHHSTVTQYQIASCLVLAMLGALVTILAVRVYWYEEAPRGVSKIARNACAFLLTGLLPLSSLSLVAAAATLWYRRGTGDNQNESRYTQLFSIVVSSTIGLLSVVAVYCAYKLYCELTAADSAILTMRMVEPLGPCPLTLVFCYGTGLYLWAAFGLARSGACARFPVRGPTHEINLYLGPRLSHTADSSNQARVFRYIRNRELVTFAFFGVASFCLWVALRASFEWPGYDVLIKLMMILVSAAIVFSCLQARLIWVFLCRTLRAQAALPMVDAYARIATRVTQSFGLQLRSQVPPPRELTQSLEGLDLLLGLGKQIVASVDEAAKRAAGSVHPVVSCIVEAQQPIAQACERLHKEYERHSTGTVGQLSERLSPAAELAIHDAFFEASTRVYSVLEVLWRLRAEHPGIPTTSTDREDWLPSGKFSGVPTGFVLAGGLDMSSILWIRAAEDFVAMRFTTYVYHVIHQMRLLLAFALLAALVVVCGVFSYPVQPERFSTLFSGTVLVIAVYTALRVIIHLQRDQLLNRLAPASHESTIRINLVQQVVTYVVLPSAVLLSRVFPDFGDAFSRTLEPLLALLR